MAGADYDQIIFDKEGKVVEGPVFFESGMGVETYKNFLYIHYTEKHGRTDAEYTFPIISQISSANMHLFKADICAERYSKKENRMVWYAKERDQFFCGIGVYGHIDTIGYHVKKAGYRDTGDWCTELRKTKTIKSFDGKIRIPLKKKDEIESWVGITQYDIMKLESFLKKNYYSEILKKIKTNLPKDLPETDIGSYLEGKPSLFNMMWGTKKVPKDFDYKKYL